MAVAVPLSHEPIFGAASSESPPLGPHSGPTARVSFNVCVETRWGDTVVITGSSEQLGHWQPERGLRLSTNEHTYPAWRCSEPLVMSRLDVEYKLVIMRAPNATPEWEPLDDNRNRVLPLTRLGPTVSVAIGWGELSSSPRARAAHLRATPPPPPLPADTISHAPTGLTPPLRPVSLADAPRRRRSSAPALAYQAHGGSVVSTSTGRQGSTSNSPCAGPEFPEVKVRVRVRARVRVGVRDWVRVRARVSLTPTVTVTVTVTVTLSLSLSLTLTLTKAVVTNDPGSLLPPSLLNCPPG